MGLSRLVINDLYQTSFLRSTNILDTGESNYSVTEVSVLFFQAIYNLDRDLLGTTLTRLNSQVSFRISDAPSFE